MNSVAVGRIDPSAVRIEPFGKLLTGQAGSLCSPEKSSEFCGFSLTHCSNRLMYGFRDKRVPQARGTFFRAQGRSDLGRINDEGRASPCTGAEQ